MSIFHEMYPYRSFLSLRDFEEVNRMLQEAIERGHVEILNPLPHSNQLSSSESWYRDKDTGEIYSMSAPEPPSQGAWKRVELDDYIVPNSAVQ